MGNEIKLEDISGNNPNEKQTPKEPKTHLQYGILTGVVLIALFVIYLILGWSFQQDFRKWIPSLVFIILIIVAQLTHARAVQGNIKFGNLFAKGFKTAAVATCIYVVFIVLFILLDPSYKERLLEVSHKSMIEQGRSAEQIKAAMAMIKKFFMVSTIAGAVIGELVVGLIASLIGAAIAPKNPKPEFTSLQ